MSPKKDIEVLIGGKVYTLSGDESEEYMQKVALYIHNKKMKLQELDSTRKLNIQTWEILLALNIADDYFKAKNQLDGKDSIIEKNEELITALEQEVISERLRSEELEAVVGKLHSEINRLEVELNKYKAELDEYINTFGE
ncbi:cell division protein ZapA [Natranaerovirga pectinivora]|uniref:Cell division protein ZapA n=1 Tax=Natranaerovirga pectinivora TaxID=682400 RepID=A0A4R3MQD7_9FIRM|nr:cell division protein ZapA [Natranaerovirga pectinivora]TCT17092.1 cell division protein ZapA [Natranaerovirga pectinivora]